VKDRYVQPFVIEGKIAFNHNIKKLVSRFYHNKKTSFRKDWKSFAKKKDKFGSNSISWKQINHSNNQQGKNFV
jgi:hemerythrin superfamily protein